MKECEHCRTPFVPDEQEAHFCCSGCRFVNALLLDDGLERFYQLQDGKSGRPVGVRPFLKTDLSWLEKQLARLDDESGQKSLCFSVSGVTCVGCVWLIERLFMIKEGAVRVDISPATATAEFVWEEGSNALYELAQELPRYGYMLENPSSQRTQRVESRQLIGRLGVSAAAAMNTMAFTLPRYLGMSEDFAFAGIFDLIALFSATVALLVGGSYFFTKAFAAVRHRSIHIDLPIALGLAMAYLGSLIGWFNSDPELLYFDFVAMFTVLMLGGRYLHLSAAEKAQNQLQGQSPIAAEVILSDGTSKATSQLERGDTFILASGRALPMAARLRSDGADFSLAWITGEPEPRSFSRGAMVPAGATLLDQEGVNFTAEENYQESLVHRLSQQKNEGNRSPLSERILKAYLVCIIVIGLAAGLTWVALGKTLLESLGTMISIFVISCPCAIGVAIPLIDRRASTLLARLGVFVQNPALWHNLVQVKNLIFDKTGTLTLETPRLENPEELTRLKDEEMKALQLLCQQSLHPLSRSLAQQLARERISANDELARPESVPGLGMMVTVEGERWALGKPGWRGQENVMMQEEKKLACELTRDGRHVATFLFREGLRPQTRSTMRRLVERFETYILSGDQSSRVKKLAQQLSISMERAHGQLSPDEKEGLVRTLRPCLYLGDGMNDSLAFNASTVSGTPVADRSLLDRRADFLFTGSSLSFLPMLFRAAEWRRDTVIRVLIFTISYNLAAISACVLGHMTPLLAAILMPLSSLISLLIAQRPLPARASGRLWNGPFVREKDTRSSLLESA